METKRTKKVFVAMSGGVDSSVSAALLKAATPNNFSKLFGRPTTKGFRGFDVTGVFIKAWHPEFADCNWQNDRRDAMRVASHLGIPFKTFDLEKEYKKKVIDHMLYEYKNGRTPNPDVVCNQTIKFGEFYNKARKEGADHVATGHYAQILRKKDEYMLTISRDTNKDQSYFLWAIDKNILPHIIFPVGNMIKSDVRKKAEEFGLLVAKKKDSQGLCFVGKFNFKEFLKKYFPARKGEVLNNKGEIIGVHDGAILYTLGERHGFIIKKKTPHDASYYVIGRNIKKNTITVSHTKKEGSAFTKHAFIKKVNWFGLSPLKNKKYNARARYKQDLQRCRVKKIGRKWKVIFDKKQASITPGQSLVIYDKNICLGGGIIQ